MAATGDHQPVAVTAPKEAAMGGNSENPYAGQGPVLLDIGGDVGALVVVMPAPSEGLEVELRPSGATAAGAGTADDRGHSHTHGRSPADQHHDHHHNGHDNSHDHPPAGGRAAYPHVAVVARPDGAGVVHTLVYPSVTEGEYELYALPSGPVVMTASVTGGQVTRSRWPAQGPVGRTRLLRGRHLRGGEQVERGDPGDRRLGLRRGPGRVRRRGG